MRICISLKVRIRNPSIGVQANCAQNNLNLYIQFIYSQLKTSQVKIKINGDKLRYSKFDWIQFWLFDTEKRLGIVTM